MKTVPAIMLCFDFNTSKNKNLVLVPVISQNFKKSSYAGFFANTSITYPCGLMLKENRLLKF
jgi:hypothetical protein